MATLMSEHRPTEIVQEALREYVGDGDGVNVSVLAAHDARVVARALRDAVLAVEQIGLQRDDAADISGEGADGPNRQRGRAYEQTVLLLRRLADEAALAS